MKIHVETNKGHLVKEYHLDMNDLMLKAQMKAETDPVHAAASMISEKMELDSIFLDRDSLIILEKKLGDFAHSGDETKVLKLRIKNHQGSRASPVGGNLMYESELFEKIISYPNGVYKGVYDSLIGLDEVKDRLIKEVIFMVSPDVVRKWSKKKTPWEANLRIEGSRAAEFFSNFWRRCRYW